MVEARTNNDVFTLKGVIIHIGIADSGHYYSVIKDSKPNAHEELWYEFNDTKVKAFNIRDLPGIAFGNSTGMCNLQNAYILIYERKDCQTNVLKEFEKIQREFFTSQENKPESVSTNEGTEADTVTPVRSTVVNNEKSTDNSAMEIEKSNMPTTHTKKTMKINNRMVLT